MNSWVKAVSSFLYIGYLPKAQGTFGSLAGLALAWFFNRELTFILIILSLLGFAISPATQKAFHDDDPKEFVLDEVVGVMLSVLCLPKNYFLFVAAFLLFRLFDIWKPWPIILIQRNKGMFSIVGDDLAAGLLTNLILQIALKFKP